MVSTTFPPKRLIFGKLVTDLLWITHFLLLGGYTMACISSIAVFRGIVFINRDKRFFKSKLWLYFFIALSLLTPALTWEGIHSIFPAISSTAATIGFWSESVKKTKTISLFVSVNQIIYCVARNSYAAITNEIVTITSILISLLRTRVKK